MSNNNEANVVLNFKANGAVQMGQSIKELNSVMNTAAKEYRAQIAAMGDDATASDKLAAVQKKLETQFAAAQKRTSMFSEELKRMESSGTASNSELTKMRGIVADAERAESSLGNQLKKVNSDLSGNGKEALDAKDKLNGLAGENQQLEAKQQELASSIKLENTQMEGNASAADKMKASQSQLSSQIKLAKSVVANLEKQLEQTKSAYGENSTEASQMATKLNGAKTAVSELENKMDSLGKTSKTSGGALGSFKEKLSFGAVAGAASNAMSAVTGGMGELVSEGIKASDSMQKFNSTMEFAGFGKDAIAKAGAAVKDYADKTVYDLNTVSNTTAQLAANGVKDYTGLTQAAGNLNAVAGGNADTFQSVAMVLTQTAGAGKLTTENWNQLADAIPGASGKMQEAMKKNGAYTGNFRDAMSKGEITAGEFNKAVKDLGMTKAAKEAAASTSTFEGAVGSLQANVVTGIQKTISSIGKENLTGIINTVGDGVTGAFTILLKAIKTITDHATGFKILAVAVGTFFAAFKSVQAINTVVTAFKAFNAITKIGTAVQAAFNAVMAINPFTIIIVAIAAVVAALAIFFTQTKNGKKIWSDFINWIQDAWTNVAKFFSGLWSGITKGASTVWDSVKTAWSGFTEWIKGIWNGITSFLSGVWNGIVGVATTVFNTMKNVITVVFMTIQSVIQGVWTVITSLLSVVWNGIVAVAKSIWTPLSSFFSNLWNGVKNVSTTVWNGIVSFLTPIWNTIKNAATTIFNTIKTLVTNVWNAIKKVTTTVWNSIKSVTSSVWNAIKTVVSNVANSVKSVVTSVFNKVKSVVTSVWNSIKSITNSVWNGIKSVINSVTKAIKSVVTSAWNAIKSTTSSVFNAIKAVVSSVWNGIKSTVSRVINSIKSTISSVWNGIRSVTSSVWNGIKSAIEGPINAAKNTVSRVISAIRGFFSGLHLSLPSISMPPLPHFSLNGSFSLKPPSVPHLSVAWYAKGGIFTQPTIFGGSNGQLKGAGEAGPEAALPLNAETLGGIGKGIAEAMGGSGNQPIILNIDGRTFASIAGPYMSDYMKQQDSSTGFSYGRRPW